MPFRRLFNWSSWLAILLILAACTPAQPPLVSKTLTVYSYTQYVPAALIAAFEKQTGIKVTLATYSNSEEMLAGLTAHAGSYDLIIPTDYMVDFLIGQKALRPLDLVAIPNYNNIDHAFLTPYFDPGGGAGGRSAVITKKAKFSLPYQWGTTGIAYDKTKVSSPITQWRDLWRPDLAGHIVVLNDPRELLGMTLLSLGYDKNSTNATQLVAARDKLKQLVPGIIAFDSDTPEKYLLSGEAWVGVVFNGNAALAARQNPNITYIFPAEGAGIWFDNLAIPNSAPHPDAAQAFINFVLEPAQSVLITRDFPYSNPNQAALEYLQKSDATLYTAYTNSPATHPPQTALDNAKPVKNVRPETAKLYETYWAEATTKK